MQDDNKQEASVEQTSEPTAPQAESGEAKKEEQQITVPDKFKDKTTEEIIRSYLEAEKEIGRLRNDSGKTKELEQEVERWRQLGQVIEADPTRLEVVKSWVQPSTEKTPERDSTRVALENTIVNDFERTRGLDSLEPEKRKDIYSKIGTELAEMLDPSGKKTYEQVMEEIPLDRLPKYLDKAYRLATRDDAEERARIEALIQARQNNEASFGNVHASSGKSDGVQLTPEQKEAARKMRVSEADYAKNLKLEN